MPKKHTKKKGKKDDKEDFLNSIRKESYLPYKYRKKEKK